MEEVKKKRGRPPKSSMDNSVTEVNSTDVDNSYNFEINSDFYSNLSFLTGSKYLGIYNYDDVMPMLGDPMYNNASLRELCEILYNTNGILSRAIDYMTALPTLDYFVLSEDSDSKHLAMKSLEAMRHKSFTRDCIFNALKVGTAFYYVTFDKKSKITKEKFLSDYTVHNLTEINASSFTFEDLNIQVHQLPVDYCRIVGYDNNSPVVAFDLRYFMTIQGMTSKPYFPNDIIRANNKWQEGNIGNNWFILDNDKTMVLKIKSSINEPWGRPLAISGIKDMLYKDKFLDTKRNLLSNMNTQIITHELPQGKEKGTSALTDKQQSDQHQNVKRAITDANVRSAIKLVTVAAGTELKEIKLDTTLFQNTVESGLDDNISSNIGVALSLLNGSKNGSPTALKYNLSLMSSEIFSFLEKIEYELSKVINANIIIPHGMSKVKIKYAKTTIINQDEYYNRQKSMWTDAKGAYDTLISASGNGVNPYDYKQLLDLDVEEDIDNKYPVHKTSYTVSSKDQVDNGRPKDENSDNDNTIKSREYGDEKSDKL